MLDEYMTAKLSAQELSARFLYMTLCSDANIQDSMALLSLSSFLGKKLVYHFTVLETTDKQAMKSQATPVKTCYEQWISCKCAKLTKFTHYF